MADRIALTGLQIHHRGQVLVRDVSLTLEAGEVLAVVGPSGAGKTLTARSLLGLVDLDPGVVRADLEIRFGGTTHRPWDGQLGGSRRALDRAFAAVRGDGIGLLAQDARDALDPLRRVGWQVARCGPAGATVDVGDCLRRAGLDDVDRVSTLFPHELSGGMARRVTLAQALARNSRFLIVDEPTTGLDAIAVRSLCRELRQLVDRDGLGVLVITHDLRILKGLADRVLFLEGGIVAEQLDHADLDRATSDLAGRLRSAMASLRERSAIP